MTINSTFINYLNILGKYTSNAEIYQYGINFIYQIKCHNFLLSLLNQKDITQIKQN